MKVGSVARIIAVNRYDSSNLNSIFKRQKYLNKELMRIKNSDYLSEEEKKDRIDFIEKNLNSIGVKIVNKPMQDFIKTSRKITDRLDKPISPSSQNLNRVSYLKDFGLISSSYQSEIVNNLFDIRKSLINNNMSINTVDSLAKDSMKASNISAQIAGKAAGIYAEIEETLFIKKANEYRKKDEPTETKINKETEKINAEENSKETEKEQDIKTSDTYERVPYKNDITLDTPIYNDFENNIFSNDN